VKRHDSKVDDYDDDGDNDDDDDDTMVTELVFNEEGAFHVSGQVNRHNQRIMGSENPCESFDHERTIPRLMSPTLPTKLHELQTRIRQSRAKILRNVWKDFEYRFDLASATHGTHIELH
jgi:hypothetical protein